MIGKIVLAARASNSQRFAWHQVVPYVSRLFEKRSSNSLNRVIVLISPYAPWTGALNNTVAVTRWAAAASAVSYTEVVGASVVHTLFQIALIRILRPYIPIKAWGWLKRQPSLYLGLKVGWTYHIISCVRELGDVDILKSYLLLLLTDRYIFYFLSYQNIGEVHQGGLWWDGDGKTLERPHRTAGFPSYVGGSEIGKHSKRYSLSKGKEKIYEAQRRTFGGRRATLCVC